MTFRCQGDKCFVVLPSWIMLSHFFWSTEQQQKKKKKNISLILLETLTYTPIARVKLLAKYRKFRHNRGTGAEGPKKVTKPKSWVAAECQIRQWDTLQQGTKQPTVMHFSEYPTSTQYFPVFWQYSGFFSLLNNSRTRENKQQIWCITHISTPFKSISNWQQGFGTPKICTNVLNLTLNHLNRLV